MLHGARGALLAHAQCPAYAWSNKCTRFTLPHTHIAPLAASVKQKLAKPRTRVPHFIRKHTFAKPSLSPLPPGSEPPTSPSPPSTSPSPLPPSFTSSPSPSPTSSPTSTSFASSSLSPGAPSSPSPSSPVSPSLPPDLTPPVVDVNDDSSVYSFVRGKLAVETPPFNSNLPPIATGDLIVYIRNGRHQLRFVTGFDGATGVLAPPNIRSPFGSSHPMTPSKVPINFITFRFPSHLPCPPHNKNEQHFPHPDATAAAASRLVRTVTQKVPQMWETFSKTGAQVTAQDAMHFLFGEAHTLPREGLYGDLPILYLFASQLVLESNTKYFTHKTAGKFVCNSPEQVEQVEHEEKALQDDDKIQKFIAAAQRWLWSKHDFKPYYPPNQASSSDPYIPTSYDPDVYNMANYKTYVAILQRHTMSHHRLALQNPLVRDKLLAPLGLTMATQAQMYDMFERLGVYEQGSNYALSRMNYAAGYDLLQPFPTDIEEAFSPDLINKIPDPDKETRKDLRTLLVYTIDSDSTVAIDDGLSLHYIGPNQEEWIYVHIADPTRWIYANSALDLAARARVSSIYLPEHMEPMLPLEISRDVMSILPGVRSYALTFAMRLNGEGKVKEYKIFPSLLQNIKRVNYEMVDKILNNSFTDDLVLPRLYELALRRRSYRERSGAFFTDSPRSTQVLDEMNNINTVLQGAYQKANILVEEMMVMCGEVSAMYAKEHGVPIPHRTQPRPQFESEEYSQFLSTLPPLVRTYEYIFLATRATTMTAPQFHYGVGLEAYARASSPIRRYYDILVHHQIKAHLRKQDLPFTTEDLDRMIAQTQPRDEAIVQLQRATERMWKLRFFEANPTKKYFGLVLRVNDHDLLVMVMEVWFKVRLERLRTDPGDFSSPFLPIQRGDVVQVVVKEVDQMVVDFEWVL